MVDSGVIDIQCLAANLLNQFAITLRTAHIHSTSNVAFTNAADKFIVFVSDMIRTEHEIVMQLRGDFFYINNRRVSYSPRYQLNYDYLAEQFKKGDLGTIIIKKEISLEDIKCFIHSFIESEFLNKSLDAFEEKISHISSIELRKLEKIVLEKSLDVRKMVRKSYFSAFFYIKGVIKKIKSGEDVDIKSAKRIFTSIVNTIIEHEQVLLGMTTIKDYDEYTYYHCTNVSIFSVALGQRLGLDRKMLIDLGVVSLFHDLGKIEIPYEILNKPTRLDDTEWRIIQKHPTWGVKALLKMRDIDELTIRAALVAFEHHMNLNHSGYPRVKIPSEIDLFSKIVSIADRYDAMTSVRVYEKNSMPLDKALSTLVEKSGDALDPILLRYFINMVGIYPIGTLLKLDSNELGLVFENNQQTLFRPRVMLITDTNGNWIKGHVVDLTEKNDGNDYKRTIVKTMDHKEYGINFAEYLL